jgi:hypothetical protein
VRLARVALYSTVTTLAVAATHARVASAGGPSFQKGPYLQQLASTSVEVRVEIDAPGPVSVDVVKAGEATAAAKSVADASSTTFHVVHLTGLEPATKYQYVVHAGASASDKGTFTTAPKDDSGAPFSFLLYGDTRSGDEQHKLVTRALLQTPSDFLLHTGDFAYAGGDEREWQTLFDIEKPLLRDRCVFSSVGNHELNGDPAAAAYERYLGPSGGKLYGTFRWSNARFFLLNAFTSWDGGEEREWLDRELSRADGEAGLAWRFIVIHHGPFSSGRHGPNLRIDDAKIPELLARHKVDLVISGHDHIYERGEGRTSSYDLRYVISGGAGAPLYDERTGDKFTRMFASAFHFVEIDANGDHVDVIAHRPDGSVLEKCGFGHAPGWDCDPTPGPVASGAASTKDPTAPNPSAESSSKCGCRTVGADPLAEARGWVAGVLLLVGAAHARRRSLRRGS